MQALSKILTVVACLGHFQWAAAAPEEESIFPDYSESTHPDLFARYGKSGVEKIMAAERKAVAHVVQSPDCGRVIHAEPEADLSDLPNTVVVAVLCANGNKFVVGEEELAIPPAEL